MNPEIAAAADAATDVATTELDRQWLALLPHLERERRRRLGDRKDSEAYLERMVLRRVGEMQRQRPTLEVWRNEVGFGVQASVIPALQAALAPFGPQVIAAALGVIKRHRVAFGEPGSPDLWAIVDGRAAGLELKTAVGALSEVQRMKHAALRKRGVFVATVRSPEEAAAAIERARSGEALE